MKKDWVASHASLLLVVTAILALIFWVTLAIIHAGSADPETAHSSVYDGTEVARVFTAPETEARYVHDDTLAAHMAPED